MRILWETSQARGFLLVGLFHRFFLQLSPGRLDADRKNRMFEVVVGLLDTFGVETRIRQHFTTGRKGDGYPAVI